MAECNTILSTWDSVALTHRVSNTDLCIWFYTYPESLTKKKKKTIKEGHELPGRCIFYLHFP